MRSGKIAFAPHLAFGLLVCAATVHAQVVIPAGQNAGAVSQGTGSGLNGFYYGQPAVPSNAAADAYIVANPAVATFVSTAIDYPGGNTTIGDGATLATFLAGDAATLSNPSVGANNLTGQLFHFTGYLAVATPGTYTFTLNSDDGSRLNIGGVTVDDNDGNHPYSSVTNTAMFSDAGLYPIDVVYFENGGETGLALLSNLTGGTSVISNSLLFRNVGPAAVPEPGNIALLVGMSLTGAALLRRRKQAR